MTSSKLEKLAVVYAEGSASLLTIKAASIGICQIVVLFDEECSENDKKQIKLLKKHLVSYDISKLDVEEVVEILKKENVKGVVTFSEYKLRITAELCEKMNFIGHTLENVEVLTDKYKQRESLAKDSVNVVRYAILNKDNYKNRYEKVGFPAILKPRVGAGSKWTKKVSSLDELSTALDDFPENIEYILEEFLEGNPSFKGKYFGDYVSVESIHQKGLSKSVCITAKLPLTENFAETGMFIPHPFSKKLEQEILEVEEKAIKALGITEGITHTEIKLTKDGPRIIEVNGRLGGYVSEIIKRGTGIDLVKIALMIALGKQVDMNLNVGKMSKVIYEIFLESPSVKQAVLYSINGLDEVKKMEHIVHVEIKRGIGSVFDYRNGTENNIGVVYGDADNFDQFENIINFVRKTITPKFYSRGSEENYE